MERLKIGIVETPDGNESVLGAEEKILGSVREKKWFGILPQFLKQV
jgi:hypothetical protein